jgi:hypothetical protein
VKKLRIFVASPSDVKEERDIVTTVVEELRRTIGSILQVDFETIRWETHAWPDIGDDAQDVINREISEYYVFVGIMWKRYGTPTNRAASGTGEEFERAYKFFKAYNRPKIMFYFKTTAFYTTDLKDLVQFKKVIQFRKKLEDLGVLFWEYNEGLKFERNLREHLINQAQQLVRYSSEPLLKSSAPMLFFSYAREDLNKVEPIYDSLKAAGFNPWLDIRDIPPGGQWKLEIKEAIRTADFFIAFISQNTVTRAGYVQTETAIALDQPSPTDASFDIGEEDLDIAIDTLQERSESDIYILPVRLEPVEPPAPLSEFQWIDYYLTNGPQQLISIIGRTWRKRNSKQKK